MSNFIFKINPQIWRNQPNLCHLLNDDKDDKNYKHDKQYGKDYWYDFDDKDDINDKDDNNYKCNKGDRINIYYTEYKDDILYR